MINSGLTIDVDIMKQTRSLYARANIVIWKFSECTYVVQSLLRCCILIV